MADHPILFSAPMVRAILEGRKTQTRRIVKPTPVGLWGGTDLHTHTFVGITNSREGAAAHPVDHCWNCPYGKPGDLLWVRETWAHVPIREADGGQGDKMGPIYRADGEEAFEVIPDEWEFLGRWTPSIHMPRWASRITLRITGVRVERLQDISEADAQAEGIAWDMRRDPVRPCKWASAVRTDAGWDSARAAYEELWEDINGQGSWETNPWVWVVEFERVTHAVGNESHG